MTTERRFRRRDLAFERQVERIRADSAAVEALRPPPEEQPEPVEPFANTRNLLRERGLMAGTEAAEIPPQGELQRPQQMPVLDRPPAPQVDIDLENGFVLTPQGFVQKPGAKADPIALLDRRTGQLTALAGFAELTGAPAGSPSSLRLFQSLREDVNRILQPRSLTSRTGQLISARPVGATPEQLGRLPTPAIDERRFLGPSGEARPIIPPTFAPEGFMKDTIDEVYLGIRRVFTSSATGIDVAGISAATESQLDPELGFALENILAFTQLVSEAGDLNPIEARAALEKFRKTQPLGTSRLSREIAEQPQNIRKTVNNLVGNIQRRDEREAQFLSAHPDLVPDPKFATSVIDDPSLILDPGYVFHWIAKSAGYSLQALTGAGIGLVATGGNPIAAFVGATVALSPVATGDLYQTLIQEGATPEQAANVAVAGGPVAAGLESAVEALGLSKLAPGGIQVLKTGFARKLGENVLANSVKRFGAGFLAIEAGEIVTEQGQNTLENLARQAFNEDIGSFDNWQEVVGQTFVTTLGGATVGGGVNVPVGGAVPSGQQVRQGVRALQAHLNPASVANTAWEKMAQVIYPVPPSTPAGTAGAISEVTSQAGEVGARPPTEVAPATAAVPAEPPAATGIDPIVPGTRPGTEASQTPVARPVEVESITKAFNMTGEQATGSMAVVDALGLDHSTMLVKRGGLVGQGALAQLTPKYKAILEAAIKAGGPQADAYRLALSSQRRLDKERNFLQFNPTASWVQGNAEYAKSIDPDALCQKSEGADAAVNYLKTNLGPDYDNSMAWEVLARANALGLSTPCPQCFVFSARAKTGTAMQKKYLVGVAGYSGQLLRLAGNTVATLSDEALRHFSSTDFKAEHIPGLIAEMADAQARGIPLSAYTKVADLAHIFAPAGMQINISVSVGNTNMGVELSEAIALRKQHPTVGIVDIAVNDAAVLASLRNPNIDHVIPWHSSGQSAAEFSTAIGKPVTDYTREQNDLLPNGNKAELISDDEHGGDLATYLRLVEERGVTKRFARIFDMLGDDEKHLYMKLIGTEYGKFQTEFPYPPPDVSRINKGAIGRAIRNRRDTIRVTDKDFIDLAKGIESEAKAGTFVRGPIEPVVAEGPMVLRQTGKGAVEFTKDGKAIVTAFEKADVGTFMHETGHIVRETMVNKETPAAGRRLSDEDIDAVEVWAGVKKGRWTRDAEEKFTNAWVRFLRTGKAPTENLADVFRQMKKWLTEVYQRIKGTEIDAKITPRMRETFTKLFQPVAETPSLPRQVPGEPAAGVQAEDPALQGQIDQMERQRGSSARRLTEVALDPAALARRAEAEAFLSMHGRGDLRVAKQDAKFARTNLRFADEGFEAQVEAVIERAEGLIRQAETVPTLPRQIPGEPETFVAEDAAVALVDPSVPPVPPKPPRSFIEFGDQQWERFDGMLIDQVPSSVPLSERLAEFKKKVEKKVLDPLAKLNAISWDAEVAGTLTRAASGISQELYRQAFRELDAALGGDASLIRFVENYLTLRHQSAVLKTTGRGVFKYTKGGRTETFTPKQLQAMFPSLARRLGPADYAKVKAGAMVMPKLYHLLLRGSEELTPGQIEGLIKKFPFYNPILSETEATVADSLLDPTSKLNLEQIKRLTEYNTDKETTSPLAALGGTINRRVTANIRNTTLKAIAEGAVLNEKAAGGLITLTTKRPGAGVAHFSYFDKGVRKFALLGPGAEWIAKDIELLVAQPTHVFSRWARAVNNLPRQAFTTWNLGFVVTNTLFDGMTAYFTQGIGPAAFTKGLIKSLIDIFVEVEAVNRFRLAGAEVGGFFGEIEKAPSKFIETKRTGLIKRLIKRGEPGVITLKNPRDLKHFLNPFQLVKALGHAGENAARIAAYEKGLKEGLSVPEAAVRARRVTVDFPRVGEAVKVLNNWWLFLSAGVGGFMLPARAIATDPRTLNRLAVLLPAYIALTVYNQSYDEYDDVDNDTKSKWLFVMFPSNEYNEKGHKEPHLIRLLPLREFSIVTGWIEWVLGRLRTKSPETYRTIAQQLEVWYPGWSPVSMITQSGAIEWPTQVVSTTQQILANKDTFRDRELVPDELRILPVTQQYNQFTSSVAIRLGQALNISPIHLDFFFTNTLGSLGRDGLRALSLVVDEIMGDLVDPRIAELVKELREIPVTTPPQEIQVARETFLEGLDAEDRNLVLQMERVPTDKIPFIDSFIERFYKTHGGQVTRTAREIARETSPFEDIPPEPLETLKKDADQNAKNLNAGRISNKQFDDAASYYQNVYSGGSTQDWRQAKIGGAVSSAEVDALLPEAYQRSEEFQAVSAYQQIRAELISQRGGVFDADAWDAIKAETIRQLQQLYSDNAVQYALAHKDDWIDRLPEPARSVHRRRAIEQEDGSWFDNYEGDEPTRRRRPGTPSPGTPSPTVPEERPRTFRRQSGLLPEGGRSFDNTMALLDRREGISRG